MCHHIRHCKIGMGRVLWKAAMIYQIWEQLFYCTVTRSHLLTYTKNLSIITAEFQPFMTLFYDGNISHVFHS